MAKEKKLFAVSSEIMELIYALFCDEFYEKLQEHSMNVTSIKREITCQNKKLLPGGVKAIKLETNSMPQGGSFPNMENSGIRRAKGTLGFLPQQGAEGKTFYLSLCDAGMGYKQVLTSWYMGSINKTDSIYEKVFGKSLFLWGC